MASVQDRIAQACKGSAGIPPDLSEFHVCWNPREFLRKNYDNEVPRLDQTLTFTIHIGQGQALPCGEFINRTWDLSLLPALQATLDNNFSNDVERKFSKAVVRRVHY